MNALHKFKMNNNFFRERDNWIREKISSVTSNIHEVKAFNDLYSMVSEKVPSQYRHTFCALQEEGVCSTTHARKVGRALNPIITEILNLKMVQ